MEYLSRLVALGFNPDIIIDIGAYKLEWTYNTMLYYPYARYLAFEPNIYVEHNNIPPNVTIINKVLSSVEENVDWYSNRSTGDSFFKEKSCYYESIQSIKKKTSTLDHEVQTSNIFYNNVFLKLDTQGSELEIIKGSLMVLEKTDFILSEVPMFGEYNMRCPNFRTYINTFDDLGFIPFEITDSHYRGSENFQIQIDILFVNKKNKVNKIISEKVFQ
jgi:FkbM family methyltransferase